MGTKCWQGQELLGLVRGWGRFQHRVGGGPERGVAARRGRGWGSTLPGDGAPPPAEQPSCSFPQRRGVAAPGGVTNRPPSGPRVCFVTAAP